MSQVLEDILLVLKANTLIIVELKLVNHLYSSHLAALLVGRLSNLTESSSTEHLMVNIVVIGEVCDGLVGHDEVSLACYKIAFRRNLLVLLVSVDRHESLHKKVS